MKIIFGPFDDHRTAKQAAEALEKAGFGDKHVTLLSRNDKVELDALKKSMDDSDVDFYVDSVVKDGATLVVVDSDDARLSKVAEILHKHGSVDVEPRPGPCRGARQEGSAPRRRGERLRDAGHRGEPRSRQVRGRARQAAGLQPDHREAGRGEGRAPRRDDSLPARRPVNPGEDLSKERSFEVREVDEEAVVSKVARIVEEVVVSKEIAEKVQTIKETARRSDVEIEEVKAHRTFTDFDKDFHGYFEMELVKSGHKYDDYLPAFKFGYSLATSEHTHKHGWAEL